jgi:rhodanese-related sulfurtransferase
MRKYLVLAGGMAIWFTALLHAEPLSLPDLLDGCAANLAKFNSWRLECQVESQTQTNGHADRKKIASYDLRFDGTRMASRVHRWMDTGLAGRPTDVDRRAANYLSLLWDGKQYTKYYKSDKNDRGQVTLDDFSAAPARAKYVEVGALQYGHPASCLMGRGINSFERMDEIVRNAGSVVIYPGLQTVHDCPCHVLEAKTPYGDYRLWIDPAHDFSISRYRVEMSREAGHRWRDQTSEFDLFSEDVEISRFDLIDGVWIGIEATRRTRYRLRDNLYIDDSHITVTRFMLNPDHERLASFKTDDIPDGTLAIIVPTTHIRYIWHGGELIKHIDEEVVAELDRTLEAMKTPGARTSSMQVMPASADREAADVGTNPNSEATMTPSPAAGPRPHCGLYCIYSILKLAGQDVDYRDLVKPEDYGRLMGSSLAELNRAAEDYGLYAGVVTRLSTRALRDCPYQAVLHVRRNPESKEYDHYQLFLGTENGKARMLNPPGDVRLVEFSDLAPLWDGYALFVSPRPFDVDAIFTADRQRLLLYAVIGGLILLAAHLGRRLWLAVAGDLPRRWSLGLTAGQAAALVLAALLCAGFYHFNSDEGLLANPVAMESFQKAYAGGFIPRISEKTTRMLLGTGTVFIDARLSPDYERGHLEGAISVPVDANDTIRRQRTSGIPRDARVVLYCQSAGCKYAERVGVRLIEDGFTHLSIFKGGWVEWKAAHPQIDRGKREDEQRDEDRRDQS